MILGKTSPSSLNRWENCALNWLCYKQKRPGIEIDTTARDLGGNVHDMIDTYFGMISETPTEKEIRTIAQSVFDEGFKNSLSHVKKAAVRCWKNFVEFEIDRLKTWPVYAPTLTEARLENERFLGIVDFYSEECRIGIDWKTGNLNQLWDDQLRQGKIYEMLLTDNSHPIDHFYFVSLKAGRTLELPYVTTGWVDQQYQRMQRMIKRGQFPKKKGPLCKWCSYILDCEFSDVCLWM